MTREEEIKERVEVCGAYYTYDGRKIATVEAEADLRYLLARNEELQRRMEKMESVVEAARFDRKELHHPECKCHFCAAVDALDAADAEEK